MLAPLTSSSIHQLYVRMTGCGLKEAHAAALLKEPQVCCSICFFSTHWWETRARWCVKLLQLRLQYIMFLLLFTWRKLFYNPKIQFYHPMVLKHLSWEGKGLKKMEMGGHCAVPAHKTLNLGHNLPWKLKLRQLLKPW